METLDDIIEKNGSLKVYLEHKRIREIREAAYSGKTFSPGTLECSTQTTDPQLITDANHNLTKAERFISECQVAGELIDSANPTVYSGKKTSSKRQQLIETLKIVLQKVLEEKKEQENKNANKKLSYDEIMKMMEEMNFDEEGVTIQGSHPASEEGLEEADRELGKSLEYLRIIQQRQSITGNLGCM